LLDDLRGAAAEQAGPVDALLAAIAVNGMAKAAREQGPHDEALRLHDEAVKRTSSLPLPEKDANRRFFHNEACLDRARAWAADPSRRADVGKELTPVIDDAGRLVEEYPNRPNYRLQLATALLRRGEALTARKRLKEADEDLDRSKKLAQHLIARYGQQPAYLAAHGRALLALARLRAAAADTNEAARLLGGAEKELERAVKLDPDNASLRQALADCRGERKAG
jgi:tetratricopeptide (TPR) repeat protein